LKFSATLLAAAVLAATGTVRAQETEALPLPPPAEKVADPVGELLRRTFPDLYKEEPVAPSIDSLLARPPLEAPAPPEPAPDADEKPPVAEPAPETAPKADDKPDVAEPAPEPAQKSDDEPPLAQPTPEQDTAEPDDVRAPAQEFEPGAKPETPPEPLPDTPEPDAPVEPTPALGPEAPKPPEPPPPPPPPQPKPVGPGPISCLFQNLSPIERALVIEISSEPNASPASRQGVSVAAERARRECSETYGWDTRRGNLALRYAVARIVRQDIEARLIGRGVPIDPFRGAAATLTPLEKEALAADKPNAATMRLLTDRLADLGVPPDVRGEALTAWLNALQMATFEAGW